MAHPIYHSATAIAVQNEPFVILGGAQLHHRNRSVGIAITALNPNRMILISNVASDAPSNSQTAGDWD